MLGTRIAQRRVELRLSQKELANQAGISVTYLSELERNKRFPSARILWILPIPFTFLWIICCRTYPGAAGYTAYQNTLRKSDA